MVRRAEKKYGDRVSHTFIHYPVLSHRFALSAGRAAECANNQDKFAAFVDVIFAKQDSLGLKTWIEYAREAGVSDTARFSSCSLDTAPIRRVETGRQLGERNRLTGTPTVIVNGWRLPGTPSEARLFSLIDSVACS